MRGHGERLSRKKELLIAALLKHSTVAAAAAAAGISERTAYSWMHDPSFRRAYRRARQGILERVTAVILAMGSKALVTLNQCMESKDDAVRLRAATAVLDYIGELTGKVDLGEAVEELKQQLEESQRGRSALFERSAAPPNGN